MFEITRNQGHAKISNSIWYNRRTRVERILIIITILLFILLLTFFILYITSISNKNDKLQSNFQVSTQKNQICYNHSCIGSALKILDYIDSSIDPCTDFYQFACGGFFKNNFIPDDEIQISTFSDVKDVVIKRLGAILKQPLVSSDPKPFNHLKELYRSCMNISGIETGGFDTLTHNILRALGGWPVLESKYWNANEFDWKDFMYKSRKQGLNTNYFMYIGLEIDKSNSSNRIIIVDEALIQFNRDELIKGFEDEFVQSYYSYMVDIAVLLGADRLSAEVELKKAIAFEIELAKISFSINDIRNASTMYNPMTIEKVQERFPGIPWLEFLNNIIDVPNIELRNSDVVDISNIRYVQDFINLIIKTPKRVQANYAMFKVVTFSIPFLTQELREKEQEYNEAVNGIKEITPRWKDCINIVTNELSLAVGAIYVRQYFSNSSKSKILEIITNIHQELYNTIEDTKWMDDFTKTKALEKAKLMTYYVAYVDELFDDLKLEEYYSELQLNKNSFLNAILSVKLFKTNKIWSKLRKRIEKTDWTSYISPISVNAFYSPQKNQIELPAAILQGLIFNSERPQYLNFGSIGSTIGHEIIHGFDDIGRKYDEKGNLKNWWSNSTEAEFLLRSQCIINQYETKMVTELNMTLNGIITQGENIADNGGIKLAYKAYQTWVNQNGVENLLPGLNFTQNQLFWISAGNMWCRKVRTKELKQQIINDFHSPSNYRVEIPFQNTEYFSQDFGCALESRMNPKHKCEVW